MIVCPYPAGVSDGPRGSAPSVGTEGAERRHSVLYPYLSTVCLLNGRAFHDTLNDMNRTPMDRQWRVRIEVWVDVTGADEDAAKIRAMDDLAFGRVSTLEAEITDVRAGDDA